MEYVAVLLNHTKAKTIGGELTGHVQRVIGEGGVSYNIEYDVQRGLVNGRMPTDVYTRVLSAVAVSLLPIVDRRTDTAV